MYALMPCNGISITWLQNNTKKKKNDLISQQIIKSRFIEDLLNRKYKTTTKYEYEKNVWFLIIITICLVIDKNNYFSVQAAVS